MTDNNININNINTINKKYNNGRISKLDNNIYKLNITQNNNNNKLDIVDEYYDSNDDSILDKITINIINKIM